MARRGKKLKQSKGSPNSAPPKTKEENHLLARTIFLLGFVVFALVGIMLGIAAYETFAKGRESSKWPSVNRFLVSAKAYSHTSSSTGGGGYQSRTLAAATVSYCVKVMFEYTVSSKTYQMKDSSLSSCSYGHLASAKKEAASYTPGSLLGSVYYDPEDPRRWVLQKGVVPVGVVLSEIILSLVCFMIGLMFLNWRSSKDGEFRRPDMKYLVALGVFFSLELLAIVVHWLQH